MFSSRLHFKKKKKKKAELKLCMEYQAEVHEMLIIKLLLGWIVAVEKMEAERNLAGQRFAAKWWNLKNRAKGRLKIAIR